MRLPAAIRLAISALKLGRQPRLAGFVHTDFVSGRWFAHTQRAHNCSLARWATLVESCDRCRQFHRELRRAA